MNTGGYPADPTPTSAAAVDAKIGPSTFNEDSLGAAIASVWGEHGAHADVYREVVRRALNAGSPAERAPSYSQLVEALRALVAGLDQPNTFTSSDRDDARVALRDARALLSLLQDSETQ